MVICEKDNAIAMPFCGVLVPWAHTSFAADFGCHTCTPISLEKYKGQKLDVCNIEVDYI